MITEDYVSYETAKLLKEKGFDGECFAAYNGNGKLYEFDEEVDDNTPYWSDAPTLQTAMKWLREEYKIEIRVIYDNNRLSWYGACNPMNEPSQILLGFGRKSKSYEEACEFAIRYCLEKLS